RRRRCRSRCLRRLETTRSLRTALLRGKPLRPDRVVALDRPAGNREHVDLYDTVQVELGVLRRTLERELAEPTRRTPAHHVVAVVDHDPFAIALRLADVDPAAIGDNDLPVVHRCSLLGVTTPVSTRRRESSRLRCRAARTPCARAARP